MEKLNGNRLNFTDYDDVVDLIHPDCQNLDLRKIDRWAMAAYGKPLNQLPLKGPDSFNTKLEAWQVMPHCLKSISGFGLKPKRVESADRTSNKTRVRQTELNF